MYNALHKFKIAHILGRNLLTERFLPFKIANKLFKKISFSKTIIRNGQPIKILLKNGVGAMNFVDTYERWFDELLLSLMKDGMPVFVDVGANVGQSLIKVKSLYPQCTYLAIEPNPHCIDYLHKLIAINGFENVSVLQYALTDEEGSTELLLRFQDDILATTTQGFRKFTKYANTAQVATLTGDALIRMQALSNISVIKLDIEGGESKAIKGLMEHIGKFEPYLICEINPLVTEDEGVTKFRRQNAAQILDLLGGKGYVCMNIITKEKVNSIDELSASLQSCNYLFVPPKKANVIIDPCAENALQA